MWLAPPQLLTMDAAEREEIRIVQEAEQRIAKAKGIPAHKVTNADILADPAVVALDLQADRRPDIIRRYSQIDLDALPPLLSTEGFEPVSANPDQIPEWTVLDATSRPPKPISLRVFAEMKLNVYSIEFERKMPLPPPDPSKPVVQLPEPVIVKQLYGPILESHWKDVIEGAEKSGTKITVKAVYPIKVYRKGDQLLAVAEGGCRFPHRFSAQPSSFYRIPYTDYLAIATSQRTPEALRFPRMGRIQFAVSVDK